MNEIPMTNDELVILAISHVENFLSQNWNIFSILNIFKCNQIHRQNE